MTDPCDLRCVYCMSENMTKVVVVCCWHISEVPPPELDGRLGFETGL